MNQRIFYKQNRRIICYIDITAERIAVRTGKPSDPCCLSWYYDPNDLDTAKKTAQSYYEQYTRPLM